MVKLASSYNNLLDLNTEIEQATQQPDQFHTADTHYDAVSDALPAVEKNPSEIDISDVEKTLNQIDQIQKESDKTQNEPSAMRQDIDTSDDQLEISDDPDDALNADKTTSINSVFGNIANQRNNQSVNDDDESVMQKRDETRDRLRNQFNQQANTPTTSVNRNVETLGHGLDQQKVTPIQQPQIDYSAGKKSLNAGVQSLSMLSDKDFDQQVDQLTQGIEQEAEKLIPQPVKLIVDGVDVTDQLPITSTGQYTITQDDDQNIIITKEAELPETPDRSQLDQQISDLQRELANSKSHAKQLQADKNDLLLQIQQLQSRIERTKNDDQHTSNDIDSQKENQQVDNQQKLTPADGLSTALVKVRQSLGAGTIKQVDHIDQPSAEFRISDNHTLASTADRANVIQQLMGSKRDSKFSQALQNANEIAVQVATKQADIKPSFGSLSLLALNQARSQINVRFS